MKREEVKAKIPGITDEQLDWIMGENGKEINAEKNKATGLQALLDHLGLAAADCVAVGDGPNDAGMLALAGRSYCMADGMKTAKAAAKALAPAAAPDGIAQLCRSLWPEIFR